MEKECSICYDIKTLVKPPPTYTCSHEICNSCWKNIASHNPVCPFCRTDLTAWFHELDYNVDIYEPEYEIPEEFIREDMLVRGNYSFNFIDNYIRRTFERFNHRQAPLSPPRTEPSPVLLDETIFTRLNNGKISCKCGSIFNINYLDRHQHSRKHTRYISNTNNREKYLCTCGKYIINTTGHIQRHQQTQLHTRLLNNIG